MSADPRVPTTGSAAAPEKYSQDLSRSLTFRENILITLSAVTPASSVFIIMPAVIIGVGGAAALSFLIAGVVGIAVGLCYAELSSAFPIAGGEYGFIARVLGKVWGFALFASTAISGVFIIGVIASGASVYLGVLWEPLRGKWVSILVIAIAALAGCIQIRTNAWITGIFLTIELAALIVLIALGFSHVTQPVSTLWHAQTAGANGVLMGAGAGLVVSFTATALFAYNGYGAAVYYAEETKQATKTIGRAIMWSLLVTVLAEMIPLIAVLLGTPSLSGLLSASDPMGYFIDARSNTTVDKIVSLGIAIAVINAVLAIILQIARILYASARDRTWPDVIDRPLARVHPQLKTPVIATLFVGLAAGLLYWLVSFHVMLIVTGANLLVLYALVGLAALVGRINHTTDNAAYRMPGWPVVPVLMVIATGVVAYETWDTDWVPVVVAVAIFLCAIPYYLFYIRPRRGDRWTLPAPADEEIE